ncbi:MAG: M48 family metallopeptidase [Burkholderiaceae bacterium]|nr:M48 family metallopeptidase [Burkholderiaceae bacterium]
MPAHYFDGHGARAWPVVLTREQSHLRITGDTVGLRFALNKLDWPERTRGGARVMELPGGASIECCDALAWDAFARACGQRDSWVVRLQQSASTAIVSLFILLLLLGAAYLWGIPLAARIILVFVPSSVDRAIGAATLRSLDQIVLQPSALPKAQRGVLRAVFEQALAHQGDAAQITHQVEFRHSPLIGPNAFALPGGTIIVTDELVRATQADPATFVGVLGHEFGHLQARHGMRLVLQASVVGVLSGILIGDVSSLLAVAPAVLGQAAYSRTFEREADRESVRVLLGAGLSPVIMATFFTKIATRSQRMDSLGIAIASHPADAQRIQFFLDMARKAGFPLQP